MTDNVIGDDARGATFGSYHARRRALNQLVREYPETYRAEYDRVRPHLSSRYTARSLARAETARVNFVRFDELLTIMETEVSDEIDIAMNVARGGLDGWATSEHHSER